MTKNFRLWIMLVSVPIIISIIIVCYEQYIYGDQIYNYAMDSEDIIENEKDFIRRSRYEVFSAEDNELLLNLKKDIDITKFQTPEYINAEKELLQAQNNYSHILNDYVDDTFAPSDEMLEMDEDGNPVFYEVKEGEWLAMIADKLYGDRLCWKYIYEVNRDLLSSPDNVWAGMRLYLPNKIFFNIDKTGNVDCK